MPASLAQACDRYALPFTTIPGHGPSRLSNPCRVRPKSQGTRFQAVGLNEPISAVYSARRRVVLGNALFTRSKMRIRGPRAIPIEERPGNRLPTPGSLRGGQRGGKSSDLDPKSDLSPLNRSPSDYITVPGAHPGTRTFAAQARGFPISICVPARGFAETARPRENAIPPRSRTRLPGACRASRPVDPAAAMTCDDSCNARLTAQACR